MGLCEKLVKTFNVKQGSENVKAKFLSKNLNQNFCVFYFLFVIIYKNK